MAKFKDAGIAKKSRESRGKAKKYLKDDRLLELIQQGKSDNQIAKITGYARNSVWRRRKRLQLGTTSQITADRAREIVDQKLDAMSQLRKIAQNANELLDLCMDWIRGEDVAIQALERKVRKVRIGQDEYEDKIDIKDPHDIALRAMAEIRSQIHAQVEIAKVLYGAQAIERFQDIVIAVIGQIDPSAKHRILAELNRRRLSLDAPDGSRIRPRSG